MSLAERPVRALVLSVLPGGGSPRTPNASLAQTWLIDGKVTALARTADTADDNVNITRAMVNKEIIFVLVIIFSFQRELFLPTVTHRSRFG